MIGPLTGTSASADASSLMTTCRSGVHTGSQSGSTPSCHTLGSGLISAAGPPASRVSPDRARRTHSVIAQAGFLSFSLRTSAVSCFLIRPSEVVGQTAGRDTPPLGEQLNARAQHAAGGGGGCGFAVASAD